MKKYVLITVLTLVATMIYAQDNNQALLNKLVEKEILTQDEANTLAKESAEEQHKKTFKEGVDKVKDALNTPYLQLGGYALLHHSYSNTRPIKHNTAIRYAFMSLRGEPVKKLNYFVLFSLRHAELTEYNATYAPWDALQIKMGQQKTLIAIENQISLVSLEFIQNAKMLEYLIGGGYDAIALQNGKHNSGRDIGVKVFGNLFKVENRPLVEYALGLYQGSGVNTAAQRNNKDFAGNVLVSPFKGFRIGGGAYFGEAVYGIGLQEKAAHVRNRWILSSDYKSERFTARAEYTKANDAGIRKEGAYGIATWSCIPEKCHLLAKVEYYNADKNIGKEFIDYAAGVNYHFTKMCRVQANYTYTDNSRKWGGKNSHLAEVQLQVVY